MFHLKGKRRVFAAVAIGAACMLLLSGCGVRYERGGVELYVKKNLHLSEFEVAREGKVFMDSDNHKDIVWEVYAPSLDGTFLVVDDMRSASDLTEHKLVDDYDETAFLDIAGDLPMGESLRYETWKGEHGENNVEIVGQFYDEASLKALYVDATTLRDALVDTKHGDIELEYRFECTCDACSSEDSQVFHRNLTGYLSSIGSYSDFAERYVDAFKTEFQI